MEQKNTSAATQPSPFCVDTNTYKAVTIVLYCVLLVISFVGNALIVGVFYRNRSLRTPANYLILNMALSDLLIPTVALPWLISITYLDRAWLVGGIWGEILCKFVSMAPSVSLVVSTLSMIVIAIDRFHAIFFAMKPALISKKACRRIIFITWLLAAAFRAHFLYGYRLVTKGENDLQCAFQWRPPAYQKKAHYITWITMFSLNIVSALLLTLLYTGIVVLLNRQQKNIVMQSEIVRRRAMENRQVTYMLITVVVLFFAVWAPYHVYTFLSFLKPAFVGRSCTFLWIAYNFPLLYTITNPFIYYIFNKKYRQGFKALLCWPCIKCEICGYSRSGILGNAAKSKSFLSDLTYSQSLRLRKVDFDEKNSDRCSSS